MKIFGILFIVILIIVSGANASRAAEEFSLNKEHTTVGFQVSYMILARVKGHFNDFTGSFVIDHEHAEKSRADIIIKTASVDTGIKLRDNDIRGPSLFNAGDYPTMVFHSNKIEMQEDNTGQITGHLTLLGITKPVRLEIVKGAGKNKSLGDGFKVTGKIKRSDFGMNAFIRPIGNVVTLEVCYNMADCGDEDTDLDKGRIRYNQ